MTNANDALSISKVQREIEQYLNLGSTSVVFEFATHDNKFRLDVITVNPRHNQSFLFHTTYGHSKIEALNEMLAYIKTYKEKANSYTIQWAAKGEEELHTSYFSAKDIQEAIDKLSYGRDPNSLTIFSVVLNPIS